MQIKNSVILIYGGVGSITATLAMRLAHQGNCIILLGTHTERLAQIVLDIRDQQGTAFFYRTDSNNTESMFEVVQKISTEHGVPNLFIHHLPYFISDSLIDTDTNEICRLIAHWLTGGSQLTQLVARMMAGKRQGKIVQLSCNALADSTYQWLSVVQQQYIEQMRFSLQQHHVAVANYRYELPTDCEHKVQNHVKQRLHQEVMLSNNEAKQLCDAIMAMFQQQPRPIKLTMRLLIAIKTAVW